MQFKKSYIYVVVTSINVDVVRLSFTVNTDILVQDYPNSKITASFEAERDEKDKYCSISSRMLSKTGDVPDDETRQIIQIMESAMHSYLASKRSFIINNHADKKSCFNFELVQTPTSIYSVFNMHLIR
jgi:hypothetical protein